MIKGILALLRRLLPRYLKRRLPSSITIVEVGAAEASRLNSLFLKKNRPANVLSFRYGKGYGEILVCPKVIRREAKGQGNTYKYQLAWMVLHGMLHLAGLHHERSRLLARKAQELEKTILRKFFNKQ